MAGFTPPTAPVAPGPAVHGAAVTPSDSTPLASLTRYLWVGTAGDLAVLLAGDSSPVTFKSVAAGALLEVCASKVMATNTTASNIVALW